MLPIEQIIPWIRHDDPLVADLALECLKWVRQPQRLTGDFILEAIHDGHVGLQENLGDFATTPRTLAYAMQSIRSGSIQADAMWPFVIVGKAPDALLTPQIIAELKELYSKLPVRKAVLAKKIAMRFERMEWPSERIQAEFLTACEAADKHNSAMSSYEGIALLVDRMIHRADCHGWMLEQFHRFLGSNGWAEIWLFVMLKHARFRPAFEAALTRFPQTNDETNESLLLETGEAIIEFCEPDDIPRLASLWETSDPEHRRELHNIVSRMRLAEAEPLLLRMTRESNDPEDPSRAAEGLCEMLCTQPESREFVRDLVDREAFDIIACDLEELAIPLGIIVGSPFAEESRWRERLQNPDIRGKLRRRLIDECLPGMSQIREAIERIAEQRPAEPDYEYAEADYTPPEPIKPLIAAPKVGRNDPCPCGSGKKYKKCCLK